MELGPLRRVAPADQSDPDQRPHRLIPESAKPERRVRPDGSRAHFLAANAAGKTSIGRGRGNGAVLDGAVALKIDLTANGCSVVPQPRSCPCPPPWLWSPRRTRPGSRWTGGSCRRRSRTG